MDFNDEDNNPFSGTSHLFASGISNLNDDFTSNSFYNNGFNNDGFMNSQLFPTENVAGGKNTENGEPGASRDDPESDSYAQASPADLEQDEQGDEDTLLSEAYTHNQYKQEYHYHNSPSIIITDAGHIRDLKGNKVIAYTISYNGLEIKRRYSEFDSLRTNLIRLLPTLIIPAIPEKHSIVKYFINPLNAKNDLKIIEKRKRLLSQFLQKCLNIPQISNSFIFTQFLTPEVRWNEVLTHPPISILPASNLLAPPLNPTKPSPLHLLLPIPQSSSINNYKPRDEDKAIEKEFQEYEQIFRIYKAYTSSLIKNVKKQKRHFKGFIKDLGELGAYYNAFSLEDKVMELSIGIERTGQAIDINYLNSEAFNFKILTILEEPIIDIMNNADECLNVLRFRTLKIVQLFIIDTTIKRRKTRLESLRNVKEQAARLEQVLKRNAEQSPTIAAAVKRLENGESLKKVSPWQKMIHGTSKGGSSSSFHEQDISSMNDMERNLEMEKLEKELVKLNDCLKVILKDIEQINTSIKENIETLIREYNFKWKEIMRNYSKSVLIWLNDNLKSWEDAKSEISKIEVKRPVELS